MENKLSSDDLINIILSKEFPGVVFDIITPFRLMFESRSNIIYFENTINDSYLLHYRINESPLRYLKYSHKPSKICLTILPERKAYFIPLEDIMKRVTYNKIDKAYLEVNIKRGYSIHTWKELLWNIKKYLKEY